MTHAEMLQQHGSAAAAFRCHDCRYLHQTIIEYVRDCDVRYNVYYRCIQAGTRHWRSGALACGLFAEREVTP